MTIKIALVGAIPFLAFATIYYMTFTFLLFATILFAKLIENLAANLGLKVLAIITMGFAAVFSVWLFKEATYFIHLITHS